MASRSSRRRRPWRARAPDHAARASERPPPTATRSWHSTGSAHAAAARRQRLDVRHQRGAARDAAARPSCSRPCGCRPPGAAARCRRLHPRPPARRPAAAACPLRPAAGRLRGPRDRGPDVPRAGHALRDRRSGRSRARPGGWPGARAPRLAQGGRGFVTTTAGIRDTFAELLRRARTHAGHPQRLRRRRAIGPSCRSRASTARRVRRAALPLEGRRRPRGGARSAARRPAGHPGRASMARPTWRIRALVEARGLADRVEMLGTVPQTAVAEELRAGAVIAVPYLKSAMTERHTSPIKAFEAMAAGRPIVCTDLPSSREFLRDGETALLVPPGDAPAPGGRHPAGCSTIAAWRRGSRARAFDEVAALLLGCARRAAARALRGGALVRWAGVTRCSGRTALALAFVVTLPFVTPEDPRRRRDRVLLATCTRSSSTTTSSSETNTSTSTTAIRRGSRASSETFLEQARAPDGSTHQLRADRLGAALVSLLLASHTSRCSRRTPWASRSRPTACRGRTRRRPATRRPSTDSWACSSSTTRSGARPD